MAQLPCIHLCPLAVQKKWLQAARPQIRNPAHNSLALQLAFMPQASRTQTHKPKPHSNPVVEIICDHRHQTTRCHHGANSWYGPHAAHASEDAGAQNDHPSLLHDPPFLGVTSRVLRHHALCDGHPTVPCTSLIIVFCAPSQWLPNQTTLVTPQLDGMHSFWFILGVSNHPYQPATHPPPQASPWPDSLQRKPESLHKAHIHGIRGILMPNPQRTLVHRPSMKASCVFLNMSALGEAVGETQ